MYLPGLLSSSSPLFVLSIVLFNFPAFELLCLFSCVSFFLWNNKKAKKFGAWRWVGSFLHSSLHTLQVCGFSYSNSWNVVLLFSVASFWIWSVELWVLVFFSFPVRFFGSHLQQIRANQGNVDTSTRSCRCLDAAALIRSWGTWRRRRRRSKRRGQTDRDREEEDRQR